MGMTIPVTPETERLAEGEIHSGHFSSVVELIVQGVPVWRERSQVEGDIDASPEVRRRAVERMCELREEVRIERDGLTLREFAPLGHRY